MDATRVRCALTSISVARAKCSSPIGPPGGMEDEVDEVVSVPRLVEPVLRRALGTEPRLRPARRARGRRPPRARGSRRRGRSEARRGPRSRDLRRACGRRRSRGATAPARFIVASSEWRFSGGAEGMTRRGIPASRVRRTSASGYPCTDERDHSHRCRRRRARQRALCASGSSRAFAAVAEDVDLVLLAGDLTTHGLPEQASVLADACAGIPVPVVAVLGNHDHHSGCADEVAEAPARGRHRRPRPRPRRARARRARGRHRRDEGLRRRFRRAPRSRTSASRRCGRSTTRPRSRSRRSRSGSRRSRAATSGSCSSTTPRSPTRSSASRRRIWAFLGSGRLAGPDRHAPSRARRPRPRAPRRGRQGTIGTVPVHNVAVHVTGQDFATSRSELGKRLVSERASSRSARSSARRLVAIVAARRTADGWIVTSAV